MPTAKRKFTVILEPESEGGYSVHCPALPGCVSQGDNRRQALKNIKEAIQLVLETQREELLSEWTVARLTEGKVPPYAETPELVAEELAQVLTARVRDGLSYAGVAIEEVELSHDGLP